MNARAYGLCFQRSAGISREFQSRSALLSILNVLWPIAVIARDRWNRRDRKSANKPRINAKRREFILIRVHSRKFAARFSVLAMSIFSGLFGLLAFRFFCLLLLFAQQRKQDHVANRPRI